MIGIGRLLTLVVATLAVVVGCSSDEPKKRPAGPKAPALAGTYQLIGDVGGTRINEGATVTLTLQPDGTLSLLAVQPGDELTDSGTWRLDGENLTVEFTEQGLRGSGPYRYDGKTLRLPVLMFGDGEGQSEWTRVGGPSGPSGSNAPKANRWDLWNLADDAAAAATKAYADAVAGGAEPQQALRAAAEVARKVRDVQSVEFSQNRLNLRIDYRDGTSEHVVTERLLVSANSGTANLANPANPANLAGPFRTDGDSYGNPGRCDMLPTASADPREPGREAVNPRGGYGVTVYLADQQPKPIFSGDSPPAAARRALLISPQYDVPHPLAGQPESIRDVTGNNIECVTASLKAANYAVDTVLGRESGGKRAEVGDDAVARMSTLLTGTKYGVVYFLGHGYTGRGSGGAPFPAMWMGAIDMDRPEVKAITGGKKLDRALALEVTKKLAELLDLTWDDGDPPLQLAPDDDGVPSLAVRADYFRQIRAKGADFSSSLLFVNGCSSATGAEYARATGAKAFLGWAQAMDGSFIADAAEQIFDVAKDHARTIRGAAQLWQLHQKWADGSDTPPGSVDQSNLVPMGERGTKYDPITGQSHVLIFRMRHGPASATSDIRKSAELVQNCYAQIWSAGRTSGLKSPACRPLELGANVPTKADVDDALYEVGATPVSTPAGRWTLAD